MATLQVTKDQVFSLIDQLSSIEKQEIIQYLMMKVTDEVDSDDTPDEVIIEGIREGLQQALTGNVVPLSEIEDILQHPINNFSGKIDAFKAVDGVTFQRKNRE